MLIQSGQLKDVQRAFGSLRSEDCKVIAEGGNDNGETFLGSFLVRISRKGVFRFTDGLLIKQVE